MAGGLPRSYYGTLKSEMNRIWSEGKIPIFDVDVYGGINLKKYFGDLALAIFIQPALLAGTRKTVAAQGNRKRREPADQAEQG